MKKHSQILMKFLTFITILSLMFTTSSINAFATSGYAYSIGGEFHNGQDVITACNNFGLCGYSSYYTNNPSYSYVSSSSRLNSDVVYFSSHGNKHLIQLKNNVYIVDSYADLTQLPSTAKIININNYTLSNTKLYVYDACSTGEGGYSDNNLCTATYQRGADCVLGWKVPINSDDAYKWQKRFQSRLVAGDTVCNAAVYANTFMDYNYNEKICDWITKGNGNITIYKAKSASSSDEDKMYKYTDISKYNIDATATDRTSIISAVQRINENFTGENYELKVSHINNMDNTFIAYLSYTYNGFDTSSGYTVVVKDGLVHSIRDNTIKIEASSKIAPAQSKIYESLACEKAISEMKKLNSTYILHEQEVLPYYDIENDRYYYRVFTVYKTDGGAFGTLSTDYEL